MKQIFIILILAISYFNCFAQTYLSSTRNNISIPIYNSADLQIGKDSVTRISDLYDDGSVIIRDSLITRTKYFFMKDVADSNEIDLTNNSGILTARINAGSITDAMLTNSKQSMLVSGSNIKTINGSSILGSGDLTVSASPSGSNTQVQYNNNGAFAASSNVTILNNNLKLGAKEFIEENRYLTIKDGNIVSYLNGSLRNHINKKITVMMPVNGNALSGLGLFTFTIQGATVTQTFANTNLYTRAKKLIARMATATTTAVGGYRETLASWILDEGINYVHRFGYHEGTTVLTSRSFVGLNASTAATTDIDPATQTNCIGVGFKGADANFQIMFNDGTGVCTEIDTGIPVPSTVQDKVYELEFWGTDAGITFKFSELISNTVFTSTIQTTNLPSVYLLNKWWLGCGGVTSCNPAITSMGLYIENNSN